MNKLLVPTLLAFAGIAPFMFAADEFKPFPDVRNGVLFVGGKVGKTEAIIIQALALLPQPAEYDIPAKFVNSVSEAGKLDDFKVVIFCAQDSAAVPLTDTEMSQISSVAENGGLVVFLGESLAKLKPSREGLGSLAAFVGAKRLERGGNGSPTESALQLEPLLGKKARPWMNGGYALADLTTARPLISDGKSANAALNSVGKGTVAFFGSPLTAARPDTGIEAYTGLIEVLILKAGVSKIATQRETWQLIPLGPNIEPAPVVEAPVKQKLETLRASKELSGEPSKLTLKGRPVSAIVIAEKPTPAADQAALQIQQAVKGMSGASLPILSEREIEKRGSKFVKTGDAGEAFESVVLVGDSKWLAEEGIRPGDMPLEGFTHRSRNGVVAICGRDVRDNGLELYGTLYGAFDFLEQQFGARWLWPGELGTVLPPHENLSARPLETSDAPLLRVRKLRNITAVGPGYHESYVPANWTKESFLKGYADNPKSNLASRARRGLKLLGKSEEAFFANYGGVFPWFSAARSGMSERLYGTHAYDGWYEKFHADHPDWFALQADGTREQSPVRPRLNKGNEGMIRAAAEQSVRKLIEDPLLDAAPCAPNDGGASTWDMGESSRKLDPPNGPEVLMLYQIGGLKFSKPYVALSDRVVTFYNAVAAEARKLRPGIRLGATAYSYYRTPPLHVNLDPSVVLFYTGLQYLNDSNLRRDRENWNAWAGKAGQMIVRPNAFHAGHGFPVVWVKKMGADIRRCYETGMIGSDWDSIIHHWATVGLNYYVLGRILWDPSQNVDDIVKDYCRSGFGPAAAEVETYFAELEKITEAMAAQVGDATESALREEEELDVNSFAREVVQRLAPDFYTPEVVAKLRGIFAEARKKAKDHPEILKRLAFLETGVDYAEIQARVYRLARKEEPDAAKIREVLEERQKFFSRVFDEKPLAINLPYIAWREEVLYKKFYPPTAP